MPDIFESYAPSPIGPLLRGFSITPSDVRPACRNNAADSHYRTGGWSQWCGLRLRKHGARECRGYSGLARAAGESHGNHSKWDPGYA